MASAGRIRVLLVEDHALVRNTVRDFLEKHPNIQVVGEAGDGTEALEKVEWLKPQVVLMDIAMPKMDGISATRFIKSTYPHVAVVGLTQHPPGYNVTRWYWQERGCEEGENVRRFVWCYPEGRSLHDEPE